MLSRVLTGVTMACFLLLCLLPWVRLNVSPSVPYGLYRLHQVPKVLRQGDLVILPVPSSVSVFHSSWVPLLKPVAALAGETVCVADGVLWIADEDYGPVLLASEGSTLPHFEGCQVIPEGKVFLASHVTRSLDSRYFDAVPLADLTALATPLLTWGAQDGQ